MDLKVQMSGVRVQRGESSTLLLSVSTHTLLPLGKATVFLSIGNGMEDIRTFPILRRGASIEIPVVCSHVGCFRLGVTQMMITDLFGLMHTDVHLSDARATLLVLPRTFPMQPLFFASGESGLGTMANATEDLSEPVDVRNYQPGDPLKKVHWKLSGRKQELLVRRYDEPILPEALMIMDTTESILQDPDLFDALTETAASCLLQAKKDEASMIFPIYGKHPLQLTSHMPDALILENLARISLSFSENFADVLTLESRRLRRTGATVILTPSLTADVVEQMIHLRRMGPTLRLYLITKEPENEALSSLILRLQENLCEVCYVSP